MNIFQLISSGALLRLHIFVAAIVLAACSATQGDSVAQNGVAPGDETVRLIDSGQLSGFVDDHGNSVWLGVPYAKAPVGELRWRAPRVAEPWQGVREAKQYSDICVQVGSFMSAVPRQQYGKIVGSEDCLYLNVWAPKSLSRSAVANGKRLPVMLWIHGGGNIAGAGSAHHYAATLAAKREVVVVTINYRLGLLGWFNNPRINNAAREPNTSLVRKDGSGNYGTLDIIESLTWVQRNIANFGGDKDNVTLFGESAGALNVYSMLLSPLADGLFHKAISQSGGVTGYSLAQAQNYTDDNQAGHINSSAEVALTLMLKEQGQMDRRQAKTRLASMSDRDHANWLRGKPAKAIIGSLNGRPMGLGSRPFVNIIGDGAVLPVGQSWELYEQLAHRKRIPLITGTNRDEAKLMYSFDPRYVDRTAAPPRLRDVDDYNRLAKYISSVWRTFGTDLPARLISRNPENAGVYAYRFDFDELKGNRVDLLGAAHGLEIPFVFGAAPGAESPGHNHSPEGLPSREKLADAMSAYWANFAYTGSPGRGKDGNLPEWKPWSNQPGAEKLLILDSDQDGGIRQINTEVTIESVIKDLENDAALAGNEEKICHLYRRVFQDHIAIWATDTTRRGRDVITSHKCY